MVRFTFWMMSASSLGFLKLLLLASLLDAESYGRYVVIFGIATLAGAIVSFGLIERTIKLYPRSWATGDRASVLVDARRVARLVAYRFALLGLAVGVATFAGWVPYPTSQIVCVCLLGLGAASLSLFASIYRAVGSRLLLQKFSFWRSGVACISALLGGWAFGWVGAILGDVFAAAITLGHSAVVLNKVFTECSGEEKPQGVIRDGADSSSGHGKLYVANMLSAITIMTDRALVGISLGSAAAGAYGLIMLLPQVFQMVVNVVSQYIGPLIIKSVYIGRRSDSALSTLGLQGVILAVLSVLVVFGALFIKHLAIFNAFFVKYDVSDTSVILAGFIAAGQIYSLIEFHLIARDGEGRILVSSLFAASTFFCLFALADYFTLQVEYFIAAVAIARWLQVLMLVMGLLQVSRR